MPTYEYACRSCDEHVEVVQSFKDEPLTECPSCGGPLRKVFGSIGISFKGSGFYKTDSRKSDAAPAPPSSDSAGKKGEKTEKAAASSTDPGKRAAS
jgi:putative FmdB family regulatory protein